MRIAYLECFSGISGDMFLGALVDAGVSPELLKRTVEALGVDASLKISRVDRSGISATKVDVIVAGEKELPREEFWEKQAQHRHEHSHRHDHGPEHHHGHEHQHAYEHGHEHKHEHTRDPGHKHHHPHRGLKEIREIIGKAAISESAKTRAVATFEALGAAEAKIHNTDIEDIHFHEVGAVDAIVDIVCAAVGAEALGVDEWVCSPLNVGGGTVECAHGTFPIPAPATLELLKNAPVYSGEIQKELVTPTGAAIVSVLASKFAAFPLMKIEKTGYGAGTRDFKGHPNVVRLSVGEIQRDAATAPGQPPQHTNTGRVGDPGQPPQHANTGRVGDPGQLPQHANTGRVGGPGEEISILECNVDDMSPQIFGYVMERAFAAGALDVFATAVQMKKNRPGMLLTLLCRPEDAASLRQLIFAETTTLGVRERREQRATLARRHQSVQTRWGEVRMKLANLNGSVNNYAPEYEDCRRIAEQHRVPLKAVMQEAIRVYLEKENG